MVPRSLMHRRCETLYLKKTKNEGGCSPMREEHSSANQLVRPMPGHFFEPLQQYAVDSFRAELDDKLIVVDRGLFTILVHGTLHIPGRDHLFVGLQIRGIGD